MDHILRPNFQLSCLPVTLNYYDQGKTAYCGIIEIDNVAF